MQLKKPTILVVVLVLLVIGAGLTLWLSGEQLPVARQSELQRIEQVEMALPLPAPSTDDLDQMLERRLVRILVPFNKIYYFLDQGQARGVVHDLGMELQKWLTRKYGSKTLPIRVVFIPTSRQHLLSNLVDGLGDIAAGNLTITPERRKLVDFTEPAAKSVNQIVVTGPAAPDLNAFDDFGSLPVYVRKSSSYYEHLEELIAINQLQINLIPADEALEDADLLEMVNAGLIPLAVVDDHKAAFWAQIFTDLTLRHDLVVNSGGRIAWAVRKQSPKLRAELNEFGRVEGTRKGLINMLLKRYLASTRYVTRATDAQELAKFNDLRQLFKKYAAMYGLDDLLLMAQGYQESRLDQSVRSRAGAVGIMQILPSTAAYEHVRIEDIASDPEQNIHAACKYMRYLLDKYLDDPQLDPTNRLLLGLAAYNAGPTNMQRMRNKAAAMGLDPNRWFANVEHAAAQLIGRETVQYVSNIYKYYLAYRLVEARSES